MKFVISRISIILFGLLFAFTIGEIILRGLGYAASDIYTLDSSGLLILNPNKKIHIRSACFQNDVQTNSLGFHSKEYSLEKPEGVFRIAIIGDSFTEAMQVPLDKMMASLLEQKLNSWASRPYEYEVIPFGISSHGTYRNILYYENYAAKFKPDLVIDALALNDIEDDTFETDIPFDQDNKLVKNMNIVPSSGLSKSVKKILRKSVLITTLRKSYMTFRSNPENSKGSSAGVKILLPEYDDYWQKAWILAEKLLKSFKEEVAENTSNFMLVSLTEGYRVHNELLDEFKDTIQGTAIDLDKPEKILGRIASENSISYLALTPIFRERAKNEEGLTVWPCDGHWNERGNEWAADALFDYLISQNLIGN